MDSLPKIPTPFDQRWREFRIRVLPVTVFLALVAGIVLLWRNLSAPTLIGIGEGTRSLVASPCGAVLQEINVRAYQNVVAGEPLASLLPVDPGAQVDLLQSQLQIFRMRAEPALSEQNAMNYERVRADLLRVKAELAMAKVNLERAENDLRRNTPLYQEKLVSEEIYDLSLKTRDLYRAEVQEKSKSVAEMQGRLDALRLLGDPHASPTNVLHAAAIADLEARHAAAQTNWGPTTLVAPISGMVLYVNRQAGEYVVEGEPLIVIGSHFSDRVVGYLRQPYPVDPEVGMQVEIRTHAQTRQKFLAEITQVGAQVETITNSLAFIRQGALVDVGLPIVVDLVNQIGIRPGETVDMIILPNRCGDRTRQPPPSTLPGRPVNQTVPTLGKLR